MKPIKLSMFQLNASLARRLAESYWGSGGTTAHRTNRKGAYNYSCSAHGGYIVDASVLSRDELKNINKYRDPLPLRLLVQDTPQGDYIISMDAREFSSVWKRRKSTTYNPALGDVRWVKYPLYVFEEDRDWAVLECFTDIRSEGMVTDDKSRWEVLHRGFKTRR